MLVFINANPLLPYYKWIVGLHYSYENLSNVVEHEIMFSFINYPVLQHLLSEVLMEIHNAKLSNLLHYDI